MISLRNMLPGGIQGPGRAFQIWLAAGLLLAGCASPESPAPISSPPAVPNASPPAIVPKPAPTGPLTLENAVERALGANPQLRTLRAAVAVAKQRRAAATDIPDPEATLAWGNFDEEWGATSLERTHDTEWRTGGRFKLPNPFLVGPRVSARTAEWVAARADLAVAAWRTECDVRRLFIEIDYCAQDTALAMELTRLNNEVLADARRRATQGVVTASEITSAAQRQLQVQNDLDQSRHRGLLARRELAALLNLPATSFELNGPGKRPESAIDDVRNLEQLELAALQQRYDIAALRWRALAANAAYREARNVRIPWLQDIDVSHRNPSSEWWIKLGVSVPIFTWTKNHAIDVVRAESSLADVQEENGRLDAVREVRDAAADYAEQRRQQQQHQNEAGPLLNEMRQTLQLLKNTPNLMPAQTAVAEIQLDEALRLELAARWRFQLARLSLERAVGGPLSTTAAQGEKQP